MSECFRDSAGRFRRVAVTPTARTCETCDELLVRRDGEKPCNFAARRHCSLDCVPRTRIGNPTPAALMSHADIGKALGLTRQRIQQIEKQALKKLVAALKRRGVSMGDLL